MTIIIKKSHLNLPTADLIFILWSIIQYLVRVHFLFLHLFFSLSPLSLLFFSFALPLFFLSFIFLSLFLSLLSFFLLYVFFSLFFHSFFFLILFPTFTCSLSFSLLLFPPLFLSLPKIMAISNYPVLSYCFFLGCDCDPAGSNIYSRTWQLRPPTELPKWSYFQGGLNCKNASSAIKNNNVLQVYIAMITKYQSNGLKISQVSFFESELVSMMNPKMR